MGRITLRANSSLSHYATKAITPQSMGAHDTYTHAFADMKVISVQPRAQMTARHHQEAKTLFIK